MQKKCGSVAGTKYKLPFGYRKDYGGLVMKKIFILCALLITMFTSVCGAEPVSSYCKLDQSKWLWLSSTDFQGTFFDYTSVEKVPDKNEKKVWVCT